MAYADKGLTGVSYICVRCGEKMSYDQIMTTPEVKCLNCGYRVLKKIRPAVVKTVKAR